MPLLVIKLIIYPLYTVFNYCMISLGTLKYKNTWKQNPGIDIP